MRDVQTPDFAADSGYRGYLQESSVRVHSVYNAGDRTWPGYNLAQKLLKPTGRGSTQYQYRPNRRPDKQFRVRKRVGLFFSRTRPVTDPHEILAFIAQSKTQALGAEARVQGVISGVSDVGRDPYDFGAGHTVAWAWGPHRTTEYYNLVLDLFNIPFRSERL